MKGCQQIKNVDRARLSSGFIPGWSWTTALLFRMRTEVVRNLQSSNTLRQSSGKLVGGKLGKMCPQRAQEVIILPVFFAACLPWI